MKFLNNTFAGKPSGYPYRVTSFIISLGVHCVLIASLALISTDNDPPMKAVSTDLSQMNVRKVVIYNIRTKPADVRPLRSSGKSAEPQGTEVSRQAVIATSPNAKSTEQFIWQPAPKIQIKHDLRTNNLIARMVTSLPSPPAPPKDNPAQKEVDAASAAQRNDSPPEPKGDLNHSSESLNKPIETPKEARVFVPPPPLARKPQLPLQSPMPDAPALQGGSARMNLPVGTGIPAFSNGSAPPPTAPLAPASTPGNARVDIAVASLHPNDTTDELPEGERPGRFSKAPTKGAPGTGELAGSPALVVPNLTIREDKTKSLKVREDKSNLRAILYTEKVRSVSASTLSVPLRPSSRTIPKAVDARFHGRNVYTMVIPIENLPAYAGDWILWFAEREPKTGETPLMRAPLPFRKLEPVDQPVAGTSAGERVQVMAILQKDGRLDDVTAFAKAGAAVEQAVMRDIGSWEFRPATSNGVPVAVDVVIEIPFVYPLALAKRALP